MGCGASVIDPDFSAFTPAVELAGEWRATCQDQWNMIMNYGPLAAECAREFPKFRDTISEHNGKIEFDRGSWGCGHGQIFRGGAPGHFIGRATFTESSKFLIKGLRYKLIGELLDGDILKYTCIGLNGVDKGLHKPTYFIRSKTAWSEAGSSRPPSQNSVNSQKSQNSHDSPSNSAGSKKSKTADEFVAEWRAFLVNDVGILPESDAQRYAKAFVEEGYVRSDYNLLQEDTLNSVMKAGHAQKMMVYLSQCNPDEEEPANPDAKYTAIDLQFGKAADAAHGIEHLLGVLAEELASRLQRAGGFLQAMEIEIMEHGDEVDIANWRYIRYGKARSPEDMPKHVKADIEKGSYHGGSLAPEDYDMGHDGMTLNDFVNVEESEAALLESHHVAAARLYTSSSFRKINTPLRKGQKPHPWPIVTKVLDEAVKRLRVVNANRPGFMEEIDLWRGMAGVKLDLAKFRHEGGTELAPMSTSADRQVAEKYSSGPNAIIFHYKARGLAKGVSLQFLSLYPKEAEWLYPPGTFLNVDKVMPGGTKKVITISPQMP